MLRAKGFKGLVGLSVFAVICFADESVPTVATPRSEVITQTPGLSAPFEVDVTSLFTNDLHSMSYDELTNLLDSAKTDLKASGTAIPTLQAARRDARTKALQTNPAVLELRKQIEALKKQVEEVVENDPGYVFARDALISEQKSVMILSKKTQMLTKEIWDREQAQSAAGTVTNTP